jgi:hypothetical protein
MNLEPAREMLRADGSDLELLSFEEGVARLRLHLESASCADCVLPKDLLAEVSLKLLQPLNAGLLRVEIDDPRAH